MKRLHPYLIWALVGMLVLTGQSMAQVRVAAAAAGQMLICTGSAAVVVYVDADGQPTQAPHICPDCLTLATMAILPPVVLPVGTMRRAAVLPLVAPEPLVFGVVQFARGPPVFV